MICTVIDRRREAIALNARPVYCDGSGEGGYSDRLASYMLSDLKEHSGIRMKEFRF